MDIAPVVGSAIAAMTNPTGTVLGEAAQLAADLGAEASQSVALVGLPKEDKDEYQNPQPKSGINFVAYNEKFKLVPENTGVLMVEDNIHTIQTLATDRIIIRESGFLEVYAHNEAQTPVYFDNMTVSRRAGAALEVNAYYPYGMLNPGLSSSNGDAPNAYKYNAKELQKELNLNWLDYGARMYDPVVSRWWVPDPLAEKYYSFSPYHFSGNNPIRFVDPNGMNYDEWEYNIKNRQMRWLSDKGGDEQQTVRVVETNDGGETQVLGEATVNGPDAYVYGLRDNTFVVTNFDAMLDDANYNTNTGYQYSLRDFEKRWELLSSGPAVMQRGIIGREMRGNAAPISEIEFNMYYGQDANWVKFALSLGAALDIADGSPSVPNSPKGGKGKVGMGVGRSYSIDGAGNSTKLLPRGHSTTYSPIPGFNEFRSANKGAWPGYKGKGAATKAAWETYKQLMGIK